jgi:segregation and condensation protein A
VDPDAPLAPEGIAQLDPDDASNATPSSEAEPETAAPDGGLFDRGVLDELKGEIARLRPYRVRIPLYEGPMDLLLFLVRRREVSIYDVPIAEITEEYFEYIVLMELLDIEVAGEFLVMAATLMSIKAKMLLPASSLDDLDDDFLDDDRKERVDPKSELQRKLAEYQRFRQNVEALRRQIEGHSLVHSRGCDEEQAFTPDTIPLQSVSVFDLLSVFKQLLLRAVDDQPAVLEKRQWSVSERMSELLHAIRLCPDGLSFLQTVSERPTKLEVVVTFLAVLELIRRRSVTVHQNSPLGEIRIYPGPGLMNHAAE